MLTRSNSDKNRFVTKQSTGPQRFPSAVALEKIGYYVAVGGETSINTMSDLDNGFTWEAGQYRNIEVIRSLAGQIIPDAPQVGLVGFNAESPPIIQFATPLLPDEVVFVRLKHTVVSSGLQVVPAAPFLQRYDVAALTQVQTLVLNRALPMTWWKGVDRGQLYVILVDGIGALTINPQNGVSGADYQEIQIPGTDTFGSIQLNIPIYGPANIQVWAPGLVDVSQYSTSDLLYVKATLNQILAEHTSFQSYSLGVISTGTTPTEGTGATKLATWRRNKDQLELFFSYKQTVAGSAGTGTYLYPIPPGLSIDPAKIQVVTSLSDIQGICGKAIVSVNADGHSSGSYLAVVRVYDSTHLQLIYDTGSGTLINHGAGAVDFGATNVMISFEAKVPIVGW